MRFLFVGGGTGGHLAPALGLAEALRARGHTVRFLGSGRAVERPFFGDGDAYRSLELDRSRLPRKLALLPAAWRARRESIIFDPDLVVSLGGLAGAAALAARRGRPLVLLEGNKVIGKSVKLMQPFADRTLTLFPATAAAVRAGTCIGPVGREALAAVPQHEARQQLGLPAEGPALLVMGGSQGAAALNDAVKRWSSELAEHGACVIALAGASKAEPLRAACAAAKLPAVVFEQHREMGVLYSAADLALCRGGAATVAELWLHRMPSIVVPYPHHRDRQQELNALELGQGVEVVDQGRLFGEGRERVLALLADEKARAGMSEHLDSHAPEDGAEVAVGLLEEFARRNR